MKFRPSSLPLPGLMPRWLVALAADGGITGYRINMRWNGRYLLQPAKPPEGQPCVVVVAHELPFRRKLQRFPATRKARLAMLRTAPDEFPLPPEDMRYGLGMQGSDGYLYALPRTTLEILGERKLRPVTVLVSGARLDAAGCLEAFENYLTYGQSVDLLQGRQRLSRRSLLQAALGASLLAGLLAGIGFATHPEAFTNLQEWRAAPLREKGSALPRLYRSTEKMAYAQAEAARLYATPEARLPGILAQLFATVPAGHSLRSIELKNGTLKISGTGTEVQNWLIAQGFPAERIIIEEAGSYQRFRAERTL